MKNILFLSMLLALAAQASVAAPLAEALLPLPEQEYELIFNAQASKQKLPVAVLHRGLFAGQTYVRARSAALLGDHGDATSIPYLIDALSDPSVHVGANYPDAGMATTRYWANDSLKKLTAGDFGFVWDDPEVKRSESIRRWTEWFRSDRKQTP